MKLQSARMALVLLALSVPMGAGCARTISIGDDEHVCGPDGGPRDAGGPADAPVLEIDLATDAVDRTLIEPVTNRQLDTVTVGDVTGDSVVEVLVADASDVTLGSDYRPGAGTVYGFSGGSAFFTGASSDVTNGVSFRVLGASAGDRLGTGASSGDIAIGDVTGDGIADLVVGATFAAGEGDARTEAGETYVLTGGAGLVGDIDLATSPAVLRARIIGATPTDRLALLAVGDVSGDDVADVVLGSPLIDTVNGMDSGAVFVLLGGSTLTGTIDLSAPHAGVLSIVGPSANAMLGASAAIGDLGGSADGDLLIGAPTYSDELHNRGAVFGRVGPLTADVDLSLPVGSANGASFVWIGVGQNDNFGYSIAIGNVVGDAADDLVVGGYQQRCGGPQVGAVRVWSGSDLELGTTYALSLEETATVVLYGAEAFDAAGTALELGDMNGDGYLELPVASGLADGENDDRPESGEIAVYLGGPTLTGILDLGVSRGAIRIYGAAASDGLGLHISGIALRDIDDDGLADLCMGSFQGGETDGGRVDCVRSPF